IPHNEQLSVGIFALQLLQKVNKLIRVIAMLQLAVASHVQVADEVILLCQRVIAFSQSWAGADPSFCESLLARLRWCFVPRRYFPTGRVRTGEAPLRAPIRSTRVSGIISVNVILLSWSRSSM